MAAESQEFSSIDAINETVVLLPEAEISAGEFLNAESLLSKFGPGAMMLLPSGASAYAFAKYVSDFYQTSFSQLGASAVGIGAAIPIMLLSANSGGNAIKGYIALFKKTQKEAGYGIAILVTASALTNADILKPELWQRQFSNKFQWFTVQLINGFTTVVKCAAVPLSVLPSDALNIKKSFTWLSAGPNTLTSFLMNGFYLSKVFNFAVNKSAAFIGDKDRSLRNNSLILLTGLQRVLPRYASTNPVQFIHWLDTFKNKKTDEAKFFSLMDLILKMHNFNKMDPYDYNNNISITGSLLIIAAIFFTLPLFEAGMTAPQIFQNTSGFIAAAANFFPPPLYSGASVLCNTAINGTNAYSLGSIVGDFLTAVSRKQGVKYLNHLRGKDLARIIFAVFIAAFPTLAQVTASFYNPVFSTILFIFITMACVGIGAWILYGRATNETSKKILDTIERRGLAGIQNFQETYQQLDEKGQTRLIRIASNFVIETIEGLQSKVESAAYGPENKPMTIQHLAANAKTQTAIEKLPRIGWCFFTMPKPAPAQQNNYGSLSGDLGVHSTLFQQL